MEPAGGQVLFRGPPAGCELLSHLLLMTPWASQVSLYPPRSAVWRRLRPRGRRAGSSYPELGDLLLGVASPRQLGGDVHRLALIFPADHAATVIEVGADAHVIDADPLDCVVDRTDQVGDRGRLGGEGVDLAVQLVVFFLRQVASVFLEPGQQFLVLLLEVGRSALR